MSTIHFQHTTTATPEQYIAALTDFGPGRSKVFGNSADGTCRSIPKVPTTPTSRKARTVSGSAWTTTSPTRIGSWLARTTDSNISGGDSCHTYTFTRRPDGTTDIDYVVVREGKTAKRRFLGVVLGSVGKRVLAKAFANSVKAVEVRSRAATAEHA